MKKTGSIFLILFSVLLGASALADVKVSAQVDRNQMALGDPFTLSLRVESDEDFELEQPVLPNMSGIELINSASGARQSSTTMSFNNGKPSYNTRTIQTYNYILSPQKEGTLLIPIIDVSLNGKNYKTEPLKIEVKEEFRNARKRAKPPAGRPHFPPGFGDEDEDADVLNQGAPDEDIFNQLLQQQRQMFGGRLPRQPDEPLPSRNLNVNPNETFFVYLDLDKTEVYEGEQVTANWYIYSRTNIESLDRVKFPDLKGFWKEIIEEVPALQFTEELVNGVPYRKALLASHALFPIKAGTATIDEFKIKAKIRNMTSFGPGRQQEVTKTSKRTSVKVLPLPLEGRTQSFSGAVGSYKVSVKTDATTFPANQPFTIRVRFEGTGNAKLIELPNIEWPVGIEVYDTKSDSRFSKDGMSYKEFEVLVIPRKEGEVKIPPMQLTYFDPAQKKYISESTQELTLQITPGGTVVPGASVTGSDSPKETAATEGKYKPKPLLQWPEAGFSFAAYRMYIYLLLLGFGFVFILLYALLQLKNLKFEPETFTLMNQKMHAIEKFLAAHDYRKTGSEATNLIYLLVASLAGQKKADQEIHLLIKEISSKDQERFLDRINNLFDYFQLLGFSPEEIMQSALNKKPVAGQVEQLRKLSKEVVDKLRKEDKNNT